MKKKASSFVFVLVILFGFTACSGILGLNTRELPLVVVNATSHRTGEVIANGERTGVVLSPGESQRMRIRVRVENHRNDYGPDRGRASIYLRDVDTGEASEVRGVTLREDEFVTIVFRQWDYAQIVYDISSFRLN